MLTWTGDDQEVEKEKWFGFLKCEFHKHLEATKVGDANDDKVSEWLHWTIHHHDVPTFLGGHHSLRNKSAKYVDLLYLEYFRDLEMVYMTSLGRATILTYLYRELNNVC